MTKINLNIADALTFFSNSLFSKMSKYTPTNLTFVDRKLQDRVGSGCGDINASGNILLIRLIYYGQLKGGS